MVNAPVSGSQLRRSNPLAGDSGFESQVRRFFRPTCSRPSLSLRLSDKSPSLFQGVISRPFSCRDLLPPAVLSWHSMMYVIIIHDRHCAPPRRSRLLEWRRRPTPSSGAYDITSVILTKQVLTVTEDSVVFLNEAMQHRHSQWVPEYPSRWQWPHSRPARFVLSRVSLSSFREAPTEGGGAVRSCTVASMSYFSKLCVWNGHARMARIPPA